MPAKKGKSTSAASSKRGRPKKPVTKKTSAKSASKKNDESTSNAAVPEVETLLNQNGNAVENNTLVSNSENTTKNETDRIAELTLELQKAEQSKRVLYNALVRERSLNNDKPSVSSEALKTGHNFCKPYSVLSGDQKKERIRLLASVISEFADPKGTSSNKTQEVKFVVEALYSRWQKTPIDFQ